MAKIDEITVPINYEVTETSKAVLKSLILDILQSDEVKAMIRTQVHNALSDATKAIRMQAPRERR